MDHDDMDFTPDRAHDASIKIMGEQLLEIRLLKEYHKDEIVNLQFEISRLTQEHDEEINQLKNEHNNEINRLKKEHDEALDVLRGECWGLSYQLSFLKVS